MGTLWMCRNEEGTLLMFKFCSSELAGVQAAPAARTHGECGVTGIEANGSEEEIVVLKPGCHSLRSVFITGLHFLLEPTTQMQLAFF